MLYMPSKIKSLLHLLHTAFLLLLCCMQVFGGEKPTGAGKKHKPPQIIFDDPFVSTDSSNCIIPFSRAGNLIIIRAKADSTEGNFIFDTGAPNLVLNMTYFRNYISTPNDADIQGGITGEATAFANTNVSEFSFGPVHYHKIDANRISLGHIEDSKGIKIHGLLGMQLFKQFEIIIDYEKNVIHMHLISKKEAKHYQHEMLKDTAAYVESGVQVTDNKLLTFAWMGGKKLSFIIDTGAETNLIDSRLPDKLMDNIIIGRRIFLAGSGSKKVEALSGSVHSIKIGNVDISSMPVIVTNLEKLCISYDRCLDGMLGFDFLSQQKIGFNFVKRKMYIWK
jgi:predicted aspartyl protease